MTARLTPQDRMLRQVTERTERGKAGRIDPAGAGDPDAFCLACEGDMNNPDHLGCSFCGSCACEGGC